MYRRIFFLLVGVALVVACVGFLAQACSAQENPSRGQGYVFFGPGNDFTGGSQPTTLTLGAGAEGFFARGLGFGAELGWVGAARSFRDGYGLVNLDGIYQFNNTRDKKVSPFIVAGYSRSFGGGGSFNAFNGGGGVNIWMKPKFGLRLEFRALDVQTYDNHPYMFRIGLTFR